MQSLHLIEMIKWRDFNELMQFLIHFTTSRRPSWSPTRWPRYASQPFQTEAYRWWHQRGESWAGQQKSSEIAKMCLTTCEMRKLWLQPTNMAASEQLSWRTGSWDFFLTDMTSQGIRQHFFFWLTPTQTKTLAAMKATLKTTMPMPIPGNKKVWAKGHSHESVTILDWIKLSYQGQQSQGCQWPERRCCRPSANGTTSHGRRPGRKSDLAAGPSLVAEELGRGKDAEKSQLRKTRPTRLTSFRKVTTR